MHRIEIANQQRAVRVDRTKIRRAVRGILRDAGVTESVVSVALVGDETIRDVHRVHMAIDEPTDVLSFLLERGNGHLEGEVVVGAETAVREAARYGWPAENELLLYVIHGALHLVGYDDRAPRDRAAMRARERACLAWFGLEPPRAPQSPFAPRKKRRP